jgi:hypothetical protein
MSEEEWSGRPGKLAIDYRFRFRFHFTLSYGIAVLPEKWRIGRACRTSI